jgi:hypothetical protein
METMTDYNIDPVQIELNKAKAALELSQNAIRNLRESLQTDLADWAESNLDSSDYSYKELSELMQENGLEGLKRTFTVNVKLEFSFEVEIEAKDEDEAKELVEADLDQHISDHLDVNYPDYTDFDVNQF